MSDLHQRLVALSSDQRRQLANRLAALNSSPRLRTFVVLHPGEEPTSTDDLKRFLEQHLPAQALPSQITILEKLPRLPNGKVDRRTLADLEISAPTRPTPAAPATAAESILLSIWQEILGTDALSIHDDFFEMGGDSILSIQIVSRARAAGLRLSPSDLIDHPTIAMLASIAAVEDPSISRTDEGAESGPIPLTPIQNWFFGLDLARPTQWNQGMALEIAPEVGVEIIESAVRAILSRHPQLRAGFRRQDGTWLQEVAEADYPFEILAEPDEPFESAVSRLQESFRFDGSPLTRFALRSGPDSHRLIVIAHHLVIDNVSWQIVVKEFASSLDHTPDREQKPAGPATTNFSTWAHLLGSDPARPSASEVEFWSAPAFAEYGRLPLDQNWDGHPLETDGEILHLKIDSIQTDRLFRETQSSNTRGEELLLSALARTLARLTGRNKLRIGVERHGRDALGDDVDVSWTIGWFTSFYPLRIDLDNHFDLDATIKSVKQVLLSTPRGGIGYGQLRYGSDPVVAQAVSADENAEEVLFNYLGSAPVHSGIDPIRSVSTFEQGSRAPENRRNHLLEINCFRQSEQLHMDWIFNSRTHRRSTIEQWSRHYLEELDALIAHCLSGGRPLYTPSDFPDAGMNQEELDEFLGEL